MKLYQAISRELGQLARGYEGNLAPLLERLPHGSGFDNGVSLSSESEPEKLIFDFEFHHMDEYGFYTGWTSHRLVVTPSLEWGFTLELSGGGDDFNDYISDLFYEVLDENL
jgi:hypothetical protein